MSDHDRPLAPTDALDQAHQVTHRVRAAARWHGWMWLALAILTPIFWIGTREGVLGRPFQFWIAVGFGALALALLIWERRRGVVGHQTARLDRPVTTAYVATTLVVAVVVIGWDPALTPWFVALAPLPSAPCLLGAWRVLRG